MNIFLPFKIKDIGGTATFARKFTNSIQKNGLKVSHDFSFGFDVLFIIADCPIWYPLIAKLLRKKIVQRLDGVYHPATPAGRWYPLYNLKMQIIHNFLADTVVYQSEFSRLSCETFLGKTGAPQTVIIYNGFDTEKSPPRAISRSKNAPVKLLTFAKFRRRDQIEPIIESVKLLDPEKFTLDIYGSYTDDLTGLFKNLPRNILFQGKKTNEDLLETLCQYDIFLFSDQSACPNSVLEALAAGLPVAAFDRGSISELIKPGYNGEITGVKEGTDPFFDKFPFDMRSYQSFSEKIKKINMDIASYSKNSKDSSMLNFNLQELVKKYTNIMR